MNDTPIFACKEDKAEYARHLADVAIFAAELGSLQPRNDKDEDVDMDGADKYKAKREGRFTSSGFQLSFANSITVSRPINYHYLPRSKRR